MAKPTGIDGFFRVQMDAQGTITGGFEQIPFSSEKSEVERQVVVNFIASMNKHLAKSGDSFICWNPTQNEENDFDFTVDTHRGPAYLELMEVAPLSGPYEKAPASYKSFEFASVILEGIKRKSERYPKRMGQDLFLLLYVTHWAFDISDLTAACLRYWTARTTHVFGAIFSYQPFDANQGAPGWIYPFPPELLGTFDPEQVRDSVCLTLDPREGRVVSERKL